MNLITVDMARKRLAKAFAEDPGFRQMYITAVSEVIMEMVPGYRIMKNKVKRDAVAEKIIKHLFEQEQPGGGSFFLPVLLPPTYTILGIRENITNFVDDTSQLMV